MSISLFTEQLLAKFVFSLKSNKYLTYSKAIDGGETYIIDVGADLQSKFGTSYKIPATNGRLVSDGIIGIKFNADDEDEIDFDPAIFGYAWTFTRGDLLVDKIIFQNHASGGSTVNIKVLASADKYSQI